MLPHLRRPLFHYEASEDGGGGAPAAVEEPTAPAEPAVPTEPTAPAESPWSPSQEEWDQTQTYLQGLGQFVQSMQAGQAQAEPQQGFQLPAIDPWADDFDQQLAARDNALVQQVVESVGQMFQQQLGPIQSWTQEQQLAEGEARAEDIFDDLISREGDLPVPAEQRDDVFDLAHAFANSLLPELSQRYGWGARAAEAALERSVTTLRGLLDAAGSSAVERYKNQLGTLSGAPTELAAGGAGVETLSTERPDSLRDIARRYTAGSVS